MNNPDSPVLTAEYNMSLFFFSFRETMIVNGQIDYHPNAHGTPLSPSRHGNVKKMTGIGGTTYEISVWALDSPKDYAHHSTAEIVFSKVKSALFTGCAYHCWNLVCVEALRHHCCQGVNKVYLNISLLLMWREVSQTYTRQVIQSFQCYW